MTRRSSLRPTQQIDLVQRRRTRGATLYSESPVAPDVHRYPGDAEGGEPAGVSDYSWLSSEIGWMDSDQTWIAS